MRKLLFSLSCTLFVGTVALVALPMMGALLRLVSVELAAGVDRRPVNRRMSARKH